MKIILLVTTLTLLISVPAFAQSGDPCPDPNYPRHTPDGCQVPGVPQDEGFAQKPQSPPQDDIAEPPEASPGEARSVSPTASVGAAHYQYSTPSADALPDTGGSSLVALGAGVLLACGGLAKLARRTLVR